METLAALGSGFAVALTPLNLVFCLLGVTVGTAVGVLPGIGPALTVALLLPITYNLDPTSAFIMFAGIYYGAMYGGSTTAILLNTPGESGSIVTAIDGNMMAKKGRAAQALATAAIGSFVAGTIATVALTFVAPLMVKLALLFGPAEFFALMVLALVTVTAVLGIHSLAAWPACSSAWPWAWSASTCRPARRASPWAFPSFSTVSTRWWSLSACSRSARPSMPPRAIASRRRRCTRSRARHG